ncbi:MAG TPA: TIM barrel protein [Candidatus Baltobacteraceae bacterium]|nr:TIM barrel protein [Candidatus Baltobacteraceae bacterium]
MNNTGWDMMRVATAPINWNNDDLPELRPTMPVDQVLAEMARAGYEGTEYGTGFPTESQALRRVLSRHGLSLASCFCFLSLEEQRSHAEEIARAVSVARILADAGVQELILGLRGTPERLALAGRVPPDGSAGLTERQWRTMAGGIHALAAACEPLQVRVSVHPHAGSFLETREEIEQFLFYTDETAVGVCVDAGHLVYGGADPVEVVRSCGARVRYIHLKDVNASVLGASRRERWSFLEALKHYVFCDLGCGCVDLAHFVDALRSIAFNGWMVIEEDTSPDPPFLAAQRNRHYLQERLGV